MILAVAQVLYYSGVNEPRRARAVTYHLFYCDGNKLQKRNLYFRETEEKCFRSVLKSALYDYVTVTA